MSFFISCLHFCILPFLFFSRCDTASSNVHTHIRQIISLFKSFFCKDSHPANHIPLQIVFNHMFSSGRRTRNRWLQHRNIFSRGIRTRNRWLQGMFSRGKRTTETDGCSTGICSAGEKELETDACTQEYIKELKKGDSYEIMKLSQMGSKTS